MAQCPSCRAEIEDDIGLVTCSACGAQVLLELDGSVSSTSIRTAVTTDPDLLDLSEPSSMPEPSLEFSSEPSLELSPELAPELSPELVAEPASVPAHDVFTNDKNEFVAPAVTESMQDVVDFANSAASQGREGLLRFNVSVSGIDSLDIRKKVGEILNDSRFLWDANQLLNQAKNGRIEIRDLTAVKTALLVQRLRTVPVEIYWEQYAIHQ